MKTKLLIRLAWIFVIVIAIVGLLMYFYVYKSHRDISSEKASFLITADELYKEFEEDQEASSLKYADKTIEVSGEITSIDSLNNTIVLNNKLSLALKNKTANLKEKQSVKIKGRFVGYDDLFEELKMDECTIIE